MTEKELENLLHEALPKELFLMENGEPMQFCTKIGACSETGKIIKLTRALIEKCGGNLLCNINAQGPHLIKLLPPGESAISTTNDFFKLSFVLDSARNSRLQDLNQYRANKSKYTDEVDVNDILFGVKSWRDAKRIEIDEVSDVESSDDCPKPKATHRLWRAYTRVEDVKLLNYILDRKLYKKVKGRTIWETIEQKKVCGDRTWQSLKERYTKKIIPAISTFKLGKENEQRVLLGFKGENIPCDAPVDDFETGEISATPQNDHQDQVDSEPGSPSLLPKINYVSPTKSMEPNTEEECIDPHSSSVESEASNIPSKSSEKCNLDEEYDIKHERSKENTSPNEHTTSTCRRPSRSKSPKKKFTWIKPLEHPVRSGSQFTRSEDEIIIKFMYDNAARHKSKGNQIWQILEEKKCVKGRSWQSLKERYKKRILPNLHKYSANKSLAKALKYLEDGSCTRNKTPAKWERSYHRREDEEILEYIIRTRRFNEVKGCALWKRMERSFKSNRTWGSLKERFRKVISKNLHKYDFLTDATRKKIEEATRISGSRFDRASSNVHSESEMENSESSSESENEESEPPPPSEEYLSSELASESEQDEMSVSPSEFDKAHNPGITPCPESENDVCEEHTPVRRSVRLKGTETPVAPPSTRKTEPRKRPIKNKKRLLFPRSEIFQDTPLVPNQRSEGIKRLPVADLPGLSSDTEIVPPTESSSDDTFTRLRISRKIRKIKRKKTSS